MVTWNFASSRRLLFIAWIVAVVAGAAVPMPLAHFSAPVFCFLLFSCLLYMANAFVFLLVAEVVLSQLRVRVFRRCPLFSALPYILLVKVQMFFLACLHS